MEASIFCVEKDGVLKVAIGLAVGCGLKEVVAGGVITGVITGGPFVNGVKASHAQDKPCEKPPVLPIP